MPWLLALCLVVAAFAALFAILSRRARFERLPTAPRPPERRPIGSVRTVEFPAVDGTRLEGWLFTPTTENAPVVIMAAGLGGTKDAFLEAFAWRFVERGVAALVFDYRCFGGSEGLPRHWVDPERHREDYGAALAFVRGLPAGELDASRIALWGSSFSGGTAIVAAAADADVRALVVQCPFLETPPHMQPRGLAMARFVVAATLDLMSFFPPVYVPLFGRPGEWVFAPSAENPSVDDFAGPLGSRFWRELPSPPLGGWENRMLARVLATFDKFVPMEHVAAVRCPTLFVAARRDDMVPPEFVTRAHERASAAIKELLVLDCGHFDLYVGDAYEANVKLQAEFLAAQLAT